MKIEDLKKQIETTISTTKKSLKLGELRVLAFLFLLLLAPAGARPTSICVCSLEISGSCGNRLK
jgi:hypothetical protein